MISQTPIAAAALLAVLGLCACSSSKKTADSDTGRNYSHRYNSASTYTVKHRSSFEKQAQKSEKSVKTGSYHSKEYATKKAGGMSREYHSKEFAQADKKDTFSQKSYSAAKETNRMGSEEYKTSESHFGDQKSHDSGKMSHDSDKSFSGNSRTYKTNSDAIGSNAEKKAEKGKSVDTGKTSYTEDEVRAILHKG